MPFWITEHLGLDFDQRNSLVVGIAMGFAVIPTIFSISEDAIYSVPKQPYNRLSGAGCNPLADHVASDIVDSQPGYFLGSDDRHGAGRG